MTSKDVNVHGIEHEFGSDADGLFLKKTQEIPDWYIDSLKSQRNHSTERREGEMMRVASIPVVIIEKWMKEGFNVLDGTKSGKEILNRLKEQDLDAFITTDKRL